VNMALDLARSAEVDIVSGVAELYDRFGQRKPMGSSAPAPGEPHFFLLRKFAGQNDMLVILNTKRCRYQCHFCTLPEKSSRTSISDSLVAAQFGYVATELKHALSIVDRVTLSNEGSVLDEQTLGAAALDQIVGAIGRMRRVQHIELETRLEFVSVERLRRLFRLADRAEFGILTGFETVDERIRDRVLHKRESLEAVLWGLDRVAEAGVSLTAYVLFKPDPAMTDAEAQPECLESIRFLQAECDARAIRLTIRLNPMYRATGSAWAAKADATAGYRPPRITDVMRTAEIAAREGASIYIGLSTEGLSDDTGFYVSREDYSPGLVKVVKLFNDKVIQEFDWEKISTMEGGAERKRTGDAAHRP
jgi:radical SAM enzyme (TIGR01210 family)